MKKQDKQKAQQTQREVSYAECCKRCPHMKNYPDLQPCSECWLVGNEPLYARRKHSKSRR